MTNINLDNIKDFMSHLFIKNTFDRFLCKEISIDTFVPFRIEGTILPDFLNEIEKEELKNDPYVPWSMLKPYCFNIIKGNRTPLCMRAVFTLSSSDIAQFISKNNLTSSPDTINGLYINIRYENKSLNIVTGTSLTVFSLDKTVELTWDTSVTQFIRTHCN